MPTDPQTTSGSKTMYWAGWTMSGVVVLFLLFDGVSKLMLIAPVVEATTQIGYPVNLVRPIGIIGLVCAMLYAVPRTAVLGAILRGLCRHPGMGRALSARRPSARPHPFASRRDTLITWQTRE